MAHAFLRYANAKRIKTRFTVGRMLARLDDRSTARSGTLEGVKAWSCRSISNNCIPNDTAPQCRYRDLDPGRTRGRHTHVLECTQRARLRNGVVSGSDLVIRFQTPVRRPTQNPSLPTNASLKSPCEPHSSLFVTPSGISSRTSTPVSKHRVRHHLTGTNIEQVNNRFGDDPPAYQARSMQDR